MQLQDYFAAERKRFPATADIAYFMTASTGLIPDYVHEGISAYQEARYRRGGDSRWRDGEDSMAMMYRSKCQMADMLGCGPEDIVYIWRMKNRIYSSYVVGTASKEFNRKAEHRISQQVYFQDIRLGPITSRTAYCSASAAERPPGRCGGPAETPVSPAGCSWTEIPWWR